MLAPEQKKGAKCDLYWPLRKYIDGNFGGEVMAACDDALKALDTLREDIRSCNDMTDTQRTRLYSYYRTISALDCKLPLNEGGVRCDFSWSPAWTKGKPVRVYDGAYERAATMWNAGAVEAGLGCQADTSQLEGIKRACQHFQAAAGCFNEMRDHLRSRAHQALTKDLTVECASMLVAVMLGQAQECVVLNAQRTDKSPKIVSMLAAQAATYYSEALELLDDKKAALLKEVPKTWQNQLLARQAVMQAVAALNLAKELEKEMEHGEAISRLQAILPRLQDKEVAKHVTTAGPSLVQMFTVCSQEVPRLLGTLVRENDSIYFKKVLPAAALTPMQGKSMVKPLPLPEELVGSTQLSDPFAKLVPVEVQRKVREYEERRQQLLDAQYAIAEQSNAAVRQSLQEMNLPGSLAALDAARSGNALPPELASRIEAVRQAGGEQQLQEMLRAKAQVQAEDARLLTEIGTLLDREESEDQAGRLQYAAQGTWNCTPSNILTVQLRQEVGKLKVALEAAGKSDALVQKKVEDITPDLRAFALGAAHVATLLPKPAPGSETGGEEFVQPLRQCLAALDGLVAHRLRVVARLRELARDDNVTTLLMGSTLTPEALFQQQLDRLYSESIKELETNAVNQRQQLDVIRDINRSFVAARSSESVPLREACQRIARASSVFQEVNDNLKEGITFYTELQSLCIRYKRQAEDFCFARAQERQEMMGYAQQAASAPAYVPPPAQPVQHHPVQQQQHQQPYHAPPPAYGASPYTQHPTAHAPPPQYRPPPHQQVVPPQPGVVPYNPYGATAPPSQYSPQPQYAPPPNPYAYQQQPPNNYYK